MAAALKFAQLNIEERKHLDLVIPFLQIQQPHVVCLQEVCRPDLDRIAQTLNFYQVFAPVIRNSQGLEVGVAILTSLPMRRWSAEYYAGGLGTITVPDNTSAETKHESYSRPLLIGQIEQDGGHFHIAPHILLGRRMVIPTSSNIRI